jgi:hypothetical protein
MFLDSTPSASFSHVESNEYNDHCDPKDLSQVSWFGQKLLTHLLHMKCNWINWENSRTLGNYTAAGDFSFAAGGQGARPSICSDLCFIMFYDVSGCFMIFHVVPDAARHVIAMPTNWLIKQIQSIFCYCFWMLAATFDSLVTLSPSHLDRPPHGKFCCRPCEGPGSWEDLSNPLGQYQSVPRDPRANVALAPRDRSGVAASSGSQIAVDRADVKCSAAGFVHTWFDLMAMGHGFLVSLWISHQHVNLLHKIAQNRVFASLDARFTTKPAETCRIFM